VNNFSFISFPDLTFEKEYNNGPVTDPIKTEQTEPDEDNDDNEMLKYP